MPSFETPTQQQIDAAVQRMRSPDFAAYFLARLMNPKWVLPLSERGLFANPPPTGHWPASNYLARMASHAPVDVAAVFDRVETTNTSVMRDMLEAVMALPLKVAVKLVPNICRAAKAGTLWANFKNASEFCVRLADGGELDAALALADELFTPNLDDEGEPNRQDVYWYKDGLTKAVPVFIARVPDVFLGRLCDWLKTSMEAKKHVTCKSGTDDSCCWRPAIEEHEQNHANDFLSEMVGFLREGFEIAIGGGHLSFNQALAIIERYPYLVFKRIRLHLINMFADVQPELARAAMLDHELFDNYNFEHEYAMLAGRRLNLLSQAEKGVWFGWVDAGPEMSDFDKSVKNALGRNATDEDRQSRIRYWQFEKLHFVRNHLEDDRREFYEQMLAEHGEPADTNVRIRSGWGIRSPMTVEELLGMTFQVSVETVSSWRPGKRGFMTPDIEGLGKTFEQYVASKPEEFSAQADVLVGHPAIYVHGFISQMGQAVAADREIDIDAVLRLCKWVVERPVGERTSPESDRDVLIDEDWQWTRDAIKRLVENVCKATTDDKPKYALKTYRKRLWDLLEPLCRDQEESYVVRDVSQEDQRLHDYLMLGINSARGKAVQSALEYVRWIANHTKQADGEREVVPGGFGAMPEIRKMLEWQIASENRSVEVMSVIGSQIGLIHWVDDRWLSHNADRLFDLQGIDREPREACGWAAWNAFLMWVRPHIHFYRIFRSQFAYAVDQAESVELTKETTEQPMIHLGQHLVILYGRGQLGLDDDGGLLRKFILRSKPEIRRSTMGFVGQSLGNVDKVPDDFVERFQVLWEIYWSEVGKKDAADKPSSWLFGPWFSCGQFPNEWALQHLEKFVEISPLAEPDDAVVEQLVKVVDLNIASAVRILDRMVKGDREGWRVHGWMDDARKILKMAMDAKGEARDIAERLINYLGRRGYTQLGDLLT